MAAQLDLDMPVHIISTDDEAPDEEWALVGYEGIIVNIEDGLDYEDPTLYHVQTVIGDAWFYADELEAL